MNSRKDVQSVMLYDLTAKQIQFFDESDIGAVDNGVKVPIGSIRNGIYMVQVDFDNNSSVHFKVVVKN